MIALRTLIIIILIIIGLTFLILIILSFFNAGGISGTFNQFCKITIGAILGDFGKNKCDAITSFI